MPHQTAQPRIPRPNPVERMPDEGASDAQREEAQPVFLVRLDVPFNDVFVFVLKVWLSVGIIAALIALIVGVVWFVAGG